MAAMSTRGTALRRRTVIAMALGAVGLAAAGGTQASAAALVGLQVIDRATGEASQVWRHAGRSYVAGRPGARYSLRVSNDSDRRVLVVMSVDGVNVLTGQTASFGQRGYVLDAYESYDVSGWRKSDAEIAAFTFAPLSRSYAARTGRPHEVGVIGVAAFTERAEPVVSDTRDRNISADAAAAGESRAPPARPSAPSSVARAAPFAAAPRAAEKLGTGHGRREWSAVTTVAFDRSTPYPQSVLRIEYDSYDNLVASGVITHPPSTPHRPRPFPLSPERNGYVPDPPGDG